MTAVTVQKAAKEADRTLPVFRDIEKLTQRIRDRAFAAFAARAGQQDWALNDWLTAERELCGPASELVEREKDYMLTVALAGFKPEDITVTATPRELIVHGAVEETRRHKAKQTDERVYWSEFRSSDVYRRVELPAEILVDKVSARYEDGLLKITAPKVTAPKATAPKAKRPARVSRASTKD
ncbi:MAG: Hsp20/alpha crystallin family protein [Steroidobacteraceae bacterium]